MSGPAAADVAVQIGAELPDRPGLDADVVVVVAGPGKAEEAWTLRWQTGRLVAAEAGAAAAPGLTLTAARSDLASLADGTMPPTVAFMRGRLKTAGDPGLVLRLLEAADAPGPDGRSAFDRWVGAFQDR